MKDFVTIVCERLRRRGVGTVFSSQSAERGNWDPLEFCKVVFFQGLLEIQGSGCRWGGGRGGGSTGTWARILWGRRSGL